jgi:hypothetical protein
LHNSGLFIITVYICPKLICVCNNNIETNKEFQTAKSVFRNATMLRFSVALHLFQCVF